MFFPFMMDVSEKEILVIGGGRVALRKCALFLDFGARVIAAAPAFCPELEALEGIQRLYTAYAPALLEGVFAVVAATDDEAVNRLAAADCKARQVPVNVVDVPELCSFIVPATVRRGDLVLSVSTGGKSPALAARLRRELEMAYPEQWGPFLDFLGQKRLELLASELPEQVRRSQLLELAEQEPEP